MTTLTQNKLKELLRYDPDTGHFWWRKPWGSRRGDAPAGCKEKRGYRSIRINWHLYRAHRLAWFYVYGEWPKHGIDHINGRRDDNRIINLRDVPQALNIRNTKKSTNNTSGYNGVFWNKKTNKWMVQGRHQHLGSFSDLKDAINERKRFNKMNGFTERHGE